MKKRVAIFVSLVLVISFVSAGLFDGITGNALWDNNHCSTRNLCPPGEGDCDRDSHCLTN